MSSRSFLPSLASITFLVLLTFAGLQYLNIAMGTLLDWVIGIAACWWMMGVVVIPWNTHFSAKQVVEEARISREKGIEVKQETIDYAQNLAKRFFWIAIGLHIGTAVGLYLLAYFHITSIGYIAALAALGLTLFRPLQRGYEHLSYKLRTLSHQIHYPREDVAELRERVLAGEEQIKHLQATLNLEEKESWAFSQGKAITALQTALERVERNLEETVKDNNKAHEQLSRQSALQIAKLSEDAQFLNQVRELIRFVKSV
ncbi:hypothetical protein Q0590_34735 [Rhodocytophaga aerolata]|uniref:Uncharacterized protein n=1 Tax=Rhodocytophaga aerolata TaxID=455078 RepID=A0ABT8RJM8_9BACT|nr:hypothetical protein [Rhodocytophaga aerolata]MDO1451483.1 hypothetical protein [Rhodocytophaga aerolata]